MSITKVATGASSVKELRDQKSLSITPFVGIDESKQMGVGIQLESGKGYFWGLLAPCSLIRSWRAMKLLESLPRIGSTDVLCNSWYAASEKMHDTDYHRLAALSSEFPSYEAFARARAGALAAVPSNEELEGMLKVVQAAGLDFFDFDETKRVLSAPSRTVEEVLATMLSEQNKKFWELVEQRRAKELAEKSAREEAASSQLQKKRSWRQRFMGVSSSAT